MWITSAYDNPCQQYTELWCFTDRDKPLSLQLTLTRKDTKDFFSRYQGHFRTPVSLLGLSLFTSYHQKNSYWHEFTPVECMAHNCILFNQELMGTAHFSIKLASWWTGMGIACVVLQFKLVFLQWTWKTRKREAKWRSLAPLTVCEIITNKDSFRHLFQWDFAPKLYFYIFTGCKIKSSLWKYYAEENSCEWSSDHRIFVYKLGFCLF